MIRRMRVPLRLVACAAIAAGSTTLLACGSDDPGSSTPSKVPSTDIATVADQGIPKDRFDRALQAQIRGVSPLSGGTVGGVVLDAPKFTKCVAALRKTVTDQAAKDVAPPSRALLRANCKAQYEQARVATTTALIQEQWLVQQAKADGVVVSDKEVESALDQYVAVAGMKPGGKPLSTAKAEQAFAKSLAASGLTKDDVRAQLRSQLLQQRLSAAATKPAATPTTAQLQRYLAEHPQQFGTAGTATIDIVTTTDEARAKAAAAALAKGTDVQAVVRDANAGTTPTGQQGRVTITRGTGQLSPAVERAVFATGKGKVGAVVKTGDSYTAFRVRRTTPSKVPSLKKVRAAVTQQYAAGQAQEAQATFQTKLSDTWRPKTLCAKGYVVPQCANGPKQ
jgi:hypothetical protein